MTEEAKLVVDYLNKEPFQRNLNFISFQSLGQEQLLQLLNDVLAEIDPNQQGDIREETSDSRAPRMLNCLKNLKYVPPTSVDVSTFRQGIVLGQKNVIQPILFYLLKNLEGLKTRAYLAKYLVKLPIPNDILHDGSDGQIQELWSKCVELQEQFSVMHRDVEELRKSSRSTNEIKLDIKTMEDEKENLQRKVERTRKKVEGTADFNEALQISKNVRNEKEKGEEVQNKLQQQRRLMQNTEQRLQRTRQQVYDMQQAGTDHSPESLLSRMEEENHLNSYLLNDKLPKELQTRRKTVKDLRRVAHESGMDNHDLLKLQDDIDKLNEEVNKLVEKKLMNNHPVRDKLSLFRQQARILSTKKEQLAEEVQQQRDEQLLMEKEVEEKRLKLREIGGEVLKGDQYREYVQRLRNKSSLYKKNRSVLAELRSETGILTRTESILQKQNQSVDKRVSALENRKGVSGFRATQDELEKVSTMKSTIDESKGQTLDDMSMMVRKLNAVILEKKSLLAPIIKQLRPLRQKHQELTIEHESRKSQFDSTAAGLESNRTQLEQTVAALREECFSHDSRYFYLQSMCKILQTKIDRSKSEMKMLTSGGSKHNSYKEKYNKKIQEQEHLTKALREKQKNVKQNQEIEMQQATMWRDLDRLIKCKLSVLKEQYEEVNPPLQAAGGNMVARSLNRESSHDRLVL